MTFETAIFRDYAYEHVWKLLLVIVREQGSETVGRVEDARLRRALELAQISREERVSVCTCDIHVVALFFRG